MERENKTGEGTWIAPQDVFCLSHNERALLDTVRRHGKITRAALTAESDLTAQSIARLVEALRAQGFLEQGAKLISGRGKPSAYLSLTEGRYFSLGLSIMTDAVSGVLMRLSGEVVAEAAVRFDRVDVASVLAAADRLVDELIAVSGVEREAIFGIGAAITGYFIGQAKRVNPPDPLGAFADLDLDSLLCERYGRPVWLDNDGNAAAIGEALCGRGRDYPSFAYVYLGMGIGGGVVIDGRLHPGAFGNAGEVAGTMPGHLFAERPTAESLRASIDRHGVALADISEMLERFDPAWPGVEEWIAQTMPHFEAICSAIAAILDPHAIVLGGRLPRPVAERLCEDIGFYQINRHGLTKPMPALCASNVIEGDATALGAASIPLKACIFL